MKALSTERKKGKWITETINCYTKRTYCSICNNKAPVLFVSDDYYATRAHGEIKLTNYCPSCGADMRGEQDDTDGSNSMKAFAKAHERCGGCAE